MKLRNVSKKESDFLRIALGMSGSCLINNATAELILLTQDEMKRLGGQFSLQDAARIDAHIQKKYTPKK